MLYDGGDEGFRYLILGVGSCASAVEVDIGGWNIAGD